MSFHRYHLNPKVAGLVSMCFIGQAAHASTLIVPGQQLGDIFVGQTDKAVFERLKNPDAGDAAMGKAWSFWNSKTSRQPDGAPNQLGVFTARNPDDRVAYVQQIRATSPDFRTASGVSTGSTLAQVQRAFPDLKRLPSYTDASVPRRIDVYDDVKRGIAWEFVRGGRCLAVTIHKPGTIVTALYLTRPAPVTP